MHPNLCTTQKPSATKVFESWIKDSRIEEEYKHSNLDNVKSSILSELKAIVGHGLSQEKYNEYAKAFTRLKTKDSLCFYIWNSQASGENMSLR